MGSLQFLLAVPVLTAFMAGVEAGAVACPAAAGDNCEMVTGPGTFHLKGFATVGIGAICHDETGDPAEEDIPLFCREETGPNTAGGADFPNGAAAPALGAFETITVQAQWEDPFVGCTDDACGFSLHVCNDRDKNGVCSNLDPDDELPPVGYSNDGLFADKSSKDLTALDYDDASVVFCASAPVDGVWELGQILAFIGAWTGVSDLNGLGANAGTFSVSYATAELGCVVPPPPLDAPTLLVRDANPAFFVDFVGSLGGGACGFPEPDQTLDLVCASAPTAALGTALWAIGIPVCMVFVNPPAMWPACIPAGLPPVGPFLGDATTYALCYVAVEPIMNWFPNCT